MLLRQKYNLNFIYRVCLTPFNIVEFHDNVYYSIVMTEGVRVSWTSTGVR